MEYEEFIRSKSIKFSPQGIKAGELCGEMFDFQRDITRWALKIGRAAIFADCGMGKTLMQLAWADQVVKQTGGNVLILTPLAVAEQTVREGEKFGIQVRYTREQSDVQPGITITNYEILDKFDADYFSGVVLDESSILKSFTGKIRNSLIEKFRQTKYKLCCTATPAPNDHMELGNHSEFLGVMSRVEMLSMFFVHDGGDTAKWRLKGHAEEPFWKWLCSWAVNIRKPSDLGYSDEGFDLPKLIYHHHVIKKESAPEGFLFPVEALTLTERQQERKNTIDDRVKKCAEIVNAEDDPFLVWCNLNDESSKACKAIENSIEVTGSDKPDVKKERMIGFTDGKYNRLISKPKIAGFGMNWQHCSNIAFLGLSDSYEQFYQAVRRCWRFGQKRNVHVHIITAETEGAVVENIKRKERDAKKMADSMIEHMADINRENIKETAAIKTEYNANQKMEVPKWM
jgi:superfamily II DNA or RNA helicase